MIKHSTITVFPTIINVVRIQFEKSKRNAEPIDTAKSHLKEPCQAMSCNRIFLNCLSRVSNEHCWVVTLS